MCFLFQNCDDPNETLYIGGTNAAGNGSLQCGQMTLDTLRQISPFCCWSHDERAAICLADCARDQSARCQSIENAG
jgi:hypothetical protein